jgi:hypothetical protein
VRLSEDEGEMKMANMNHIIVSQQVLGISAVISQW